jgi:hypothetical protein
MLLYKFYFNFLDMSVHFEKVTEMLEAPFFHKGFTTLISTFFLLSTMSLIAQVNKTEPALKQILSAQAWKSTQNEGKYLAYDSLGILIWLLTQMSVVVLVLAGPPCNA